MPCSDGSATQAPCAVREAVSLQSRHVRAARLLPGQTRFARVIAATFAVSDTPVAAFRSRKHIQDFAQKAP